MYFSSILFFCMYFSSILFCICVEDPSMSQKMLCTHVKLKLELCTTASSIDLFKTKQMFYGLNWFADFGFIFNELQRSLNHQVWTDSSSPDLLNNALTMDVLPNFGSSIAALGFYVFALHLAHTQWVRASSYTPAILRQKRQRHEWVEVE